MKRVGIALAIAAALYGIGLGVGSLLYATGVIATGATHNDCEGFREQIAKGPPAIDEEDVKQSDIKALAESCLAGHKLTEEEAFREEYLIWSAWPAAICAVIFLAWPMWGRILHNQEEAEIAAGEAVPGHH
jgi:hypothetical protein